MGRAPHFMACALVCAAGPVFAHDTWLAADQRQVPPGAELVFDMTSGDHFPVMGSSIARERIELSSCLQGAAAFPVLPVERAAKALRLAARPPAAGAVTCWIQLKPRALDLAASKIAGYLDEIDAPAAVRNAWESAPAPKKWNEVYTKNARVIVPAAGSPAMKAGPVGMKLEFVPQVDLASGQVAGKLPWVVLRDGKPLAGLSVALTGEHGGKPARQRSDAQGRVEFAAPAAGRWMLSATDLRPIDAAAGKWESQFATLVFEVLPAPR